MTDDDARALAQKLSQEWHARPRINLPTLFRCTHVVELGDASVLAAGRARLVDYCRRSGQSGPASDASFHLACADDSFVRWEQHTEFVTHSVFQASDGSAPFAAIPFEGLEAEFRAGLLASRFFGTRIEVVRPPASDPTGHALARTLFGAGEVYGGRMSAGTAIVWSAFQPDADGFTRILIVSAGGHDERLSRLTHRLLDLESYRILAMMGLPVARAVMASLSGHEREMDAIMGQLQDARASEQEEAALQSITRLASLVEHMAFGNAFRFAASRAYARIAERRCEEVDEVVLDDHQRFTQFLLRSLQPAMRTCEAAELRMQRIAEQTARAAGILETMAEVSQKRQNQEIMRSLAKSASLQVELQQAVEGFSIFAISYYVVGLLGYVLKWLKTTGIGVSLEALTGAAVPFIVLLVWAFVVRARRRIGHG
ncbi:MAG: DUF3422 domain-containing protein [Myxococcota bacterium]